MKNFNHYFTLVVLFLICIMSTVYSNYNSKRKLLVENEKLTAVGGNITLNESESIVNEFLMRLKIADYDQFSEKSFVGAKNFLEAKKQIETSKLFEFIVKFPKGASLHTHILASVSFDYLFYNLTYRSNLYICTVNNQIKLHFFNETHGDTTCKWKLLKTMREQNVTYDTWLKDQIIMRTPYRSKTEAWKKFRTYFPGIYNMLTYRPIFEDFLYQVFLELYQDSVIYTELKGTFMNLYELNGTVHNNTELLHVFNNTLQRFMADYPLFVGAKYIYAPSRKINFTQLKEYKMLLHDAKMLYPNLIAGFDLVGFEDDGNSLHHYVEELSSVHRSIPFLFHAGETNWYGTKSDLNIIDAILLRSSRIGHALSILKHPSALAIVKDRSIAIEICPISNQMLGFLDDLRLHPAIFLISHGYPIIICNDDPTVWGAKGVSYDWYLTFMAMTRRDMGLEFLMELALNSLRYSSMDKYEKQKAFIVYDNQLKEFFKQFLQVFQFLLNWRKII